MYVTVRQKMENSPPLDPHGQDPRPGSRVVLHINKNAATAKESRSISSLGKSSDSETHSDEEEPSDSEYSDDGSVIVLRKSTRTTAANPKDKLVRKLPFSPRKTRSRNRRAIGGGVS